MSEELAALCVQDRIVLWNSHTHLLKCMVSDSKMMTVFMVTTIKTSNLTFCNGVCGKIIVTARPHSQLEDHPLSAVCYCLCSINDLNNRANCRYRPFHVKSAPRYVLLFLMGTYTMVRAHSWCLISVVCVFMLCHCYILAKAVSTEFAIAEPNNLY